MPEEETDAKPVLFDDFWRRFFFKFTNRYKRQGKEIVKAAFDARLNLEKYYKKSNVSLNC